MGSEVLALSIAVPLAGALMAAAWPRRAQILGLAAALGATLASVFVLLTVVDEGQILHRLGGWEPGLGIALRADILSGALLALTALVSLAASLYATAYFANSKAEAWFWPLWLLMWTALNALLLAADLFNLYVTLELLGLAAVSLTALGKGRAAVEAALRYLIVGLLGSMAYLAGVALLYAGYGSLDLATVARELRPEPTAWTALALMTGGLILKTAVFPLHFWLPSAHANAPAPVSAALSALVVKAGFYLILRFWLELFPTVLTPAAGQILGLLGAGAVIWGSWQAFRAERLKLLAAYSTVAQLGYLILGLSLLVGLSEQTSRADLLGGLLILALTHGFAKAGLFLAIGIVQQRTGHDRIAELGGTATRLPATTFAIALAGIALIGLPPSGAFLGKWQLLTAAFEHGLWLWVLAIAAGSVLAAAYVFRVIGHAFEPAGNGPGMRISIARDEWPALLLSATAAVILGLGSGWIWPLLGGVA